LRKEKLQKLSKIKLELTRERYRQMVLLQQHRRKLETLTRKLLRSMKTPKLRPVKRQKLEKMLMQLTQHGKRPLLKVHKLMRRQWAK